MAEIRFGEFRLDPLERRLRHGDQPVELGGRYLDALVLLVRDAGRLVSKERFLEEVWRGVPVTDEALTQCIRSLRRALGDTTERPRFIETVPKHGYRFVAPVEVGGEAPGAAPRDEQRRAELPWLFAAGVVGAGLAGFAGGLVYGLAASGGGGMGALSVLLVLLCVTILTALLGGAGVAAGLVLAERAGGPATPWLVAGGAVGGLLVGTATKLLGADAFNLLLGRAPADVTGGLEGLVVGAGVGLGAWLAGRSGGSGLRRAAVAGLACGALAGVGLSLAGRGLMAVSLDALVRTMPGSRLRLDGLGLVVGEPGFGPAARLLVTTTESALFAAAMIVAMTLARRQRERG